VLLKDHRLLITGVGTTDSIAFHVARMAQEQGAEVILTAPDRQRAYTEQAAAELPQPVDVLTLDVTNHDEFGALRDQLEARWDRLDGALHAIAYAPAEALGGNFMQTSPKAAIRAFEVSAYSYKALADALLPLLERSERQGALVGLDFHGEKSWPIYDWMGVAKAALGGVNRYLARYLGPHGVRCNLVAAGPVRTVSATVIPGFNELASLWEIQAPLGWDWSDPAPTARVVCMLLSPWSAGISGEIIHVDGGYHSMGAPLQSELSALVREPAPRS
jgi:enoyl-[acyl-carrier protein] reductase I